MQGGGVDLFSSSCAGDNRPRLLFMFRSIVRGEMQGVNDLLITTCSMKKAKK